MERRPLIAGNWKMNTTLAEAVALAEATAEACSSKTDGDVMIAPPFTALKTVADKISGTSVILGSQNICWKESGAFTGEISPLMLKEIGCEMAIIGHSERRHVFGETDQMINQRVLGTVENGLIPVFCIGETLEERESDKTLTVLESQIKNGLAGLKINNPDDLVIAYEPVWAIGTGKTATSSQAQEVHAFVRKVITTLYEKNIASQIRILYGGSVNPGNVDELMNMPDVDGALVGGAALKADSFEKLINFNLKST
jgi:triosephosphate isomerase (TIM)